MSMLEFLDAARVGAGATKPRAKWYPDPTTRHEHRYWDGEHWTPAVADGGVPSEDPVELGSPKPGWAQQLENPRIQALRAATLAERYGITVDEAEAVTRTCIWSKPQEVQQQVDLLRADPAALGWVKRSGRDLLLQRTEEARQRREAAEAGHDLLAGAPGPGSAGAWAPDPTGHHELRYWDGTSWTEHVADAGRQDVDPV